MIINNFKKHLICWGGSDQCIVLNSIIEELGSKIDVIIDDTHNLTSPFNHIPLYYGKPGLHNWLKGRNLQDIGFVIAIGNPYGFIRYQLHNYLVNLGLTPITICAPSSIIDKTAGIGAGSQIMQGVIVNAKANLGQQCILNTKSLIEHHDNLGNGVEIAPGVVLTGRVSIGDYSWIGAGSTIIPRISIGKNVIVGAGAVVTKNINDEIIAVGNPAKFLKTNPFKERSYAR